MEEWRDEEWKEEEERGRRVSQRRGRTDVEKSKEGEEG